MSNSPLEPGAGADAAPERRLHDIGPRVLSALVLAPAAVWCAIEGGPWLAGACGAASVAMSYEWARMSEPDRQAEAFGFCFAGAFGAVAAASWGYLAPALLWAAACGAASALRRRTVVGMVETFGGVIYVGSPCALFMALRALDPGGLEAVLALFMIIWSTDAAAYFGGTLIGGPRVSRRLSPQKTWSGLASGVLAGTLAGLGCAALFGGAVGLWALAGGVLGAVGLAGDLFESLLKRRFGVKDASSLIPGHGGFLDRLDGLMAATVLTALALAVDPDLVERLMGAAR
ncbi:MAG: phosphatidate cytidylyltransferase [Hyphomonadaceae bacterium]|nr:phosphatidate cytidylyltransferase [Hyphomonadaceae bacterium]